MKKILLFLFLVCSKHSFSQSNNFDTVKSFDLTYYQLAGCISPEYTYINCFFENEKFIISYYSDYSERGLTTQEFSKEEFFAFYDSLTTKKYLNIDSLDKILNIQDISFDESYYSLKINNKDIKTRKYTIAFTDESVLPIIAWLVKKGVSLELNANGSLLLLAESKMQEMENNYEIIMTTIEWDKAIVLKNRLIFDLKKSLLKKDELLYDFFNDYFEIKAEFNDILYDELNSDTLFKYSNSKTDLNQKILNSGFKIRKFVDTWNGDKLILGTSSSFIEKDILDILDSTSKQFVILYCNEIENPFNNNYEYLIPKKDIVERAYKWGELLDNTTGKAYYKTVNQQYNIIASIIMMEIVDTEFRKEFQDLVLESINKYPNMRATKDFKDFFDLLKSENMIYTKKVENYIDGFNWN